MKTTIFRLLLFLLLPLTLMAQRRPTAVDSFSDLVNLIPSPGQPDVIVVNTNTNTRIQFRYYPSSSTATNNATPYVFATSTGTGRWKEVELTGTTDDIVLGGDPRLNGDYASLVPITGDTKISLINDSPSAPLLQETLSSVPTISALTNADYQLFNGYNIVNVEGYYTAGDGGGGQFRRVLETGQTVDNGIYFAFAGTTSWLLERVRNTSSIDVRAFGVKDDGSTDNAAALDRAYAALASGTVGELLFPEGTIITSGNSITPTTDFMLKLTGVSSKANTAVAPYGSRLKLKDGSTNSILTLNLSTSYRVRPSVKGIYFDGNKAGAESGQYCVKIVGVVFPAYTSGGTWDDCAFNRGKLGGLYATNVFQLVVNNCNFQSNGGDGVTLAGIGGDSYFSSCVFEKSGRHGVYMEENQNTVFARCEFAFSQDNGMLLEDSIGTVLLGCDWSYNGANGLEIKGNTGSTTGTQNTYVIGGRMCLANWGNPGDGGTPYASGTYSNLKISGDANPQGNHYFSGVQLYAPGGESASTNKPKYLVEDARSNANYTAAPGLGLTFAGVNAPTDTNYFVTGRFTSGMETNSAWVGLGNHANGTAYTLPAVTINSGIVNSTLTIGEASATTKRLTVIGGDGGADLMMLSRPGVADISFRLGSDALIVYASNSAAALFGGQYSGGPIFTVGHPSAQAATPPANTYLRSQQPTTGAGSDVAGGTLNIESSPGTGNSTSNGDIAFRTPDETASGTTVQTLSSKVIVRRQGQLALYNTTSDPTVNLADGNIWYRSDTDQFNVRVNGATTQLATASDISTIQIPASAMSPFATDGATAVTTTLATTGLPVDEYSFDASTDKKVAVKVTFPPGWNGTTLTATFKWRTTATSGNCVWAIQARYARDGDNIDTTFGTAVTVTDGAQGTANYQSISSATGTITPSGTFASGCSVYFIIYRDADNGSDTLASAALLDDVILTWR